MKPKTLYLLIITLLILNSCNSYRYIYDPDSKQRQHKLQNTRAGNACGDIFLFMGSVFVEAVSGIYVGYVPERQEFKRIKLVNPTLDTMYVNMVTDLIWDKENYCDFWDIRIPPNDRCRLLLPVDANYNIYFGTSDNPEEDGLLEINTTEKRKITLFPTVTRDTTETGLQNLPPDNKF